MPYKDPDKRARSRDKWRANNPDYHDEYRTQHPDQYADYNKTYRQKQRELMLSWYEQYKKKMKCSNCSESREPCLDFHHTDPAVKRFEVKRMMKKGSCSLDTLLEEVAK